MKNIAFFIILFAHLLSNDLRSQSYGGNWKTVFNEQFANNKNNWTIANSDTREAIVSGGKLIDQFLNEGYRTSNTIKIEFNENSDYRIKFAIANLNYWFKHDGKNVFPQYGFIWSFQDWDNYNYILFQHGDVGGRYFSVTVGLGYKIGSVVNGNDLVHQDWQTSPYLDLKTAINEITILKTGNQLSFYVGDNSYKELGVAPAENWFSNNAGIYIQSGAKVVLDYLKIEENVPAKVSATQKVIESSSISQSWSGSGIFITQDGYIVTNNHVIKESQRIEVDLFINGNKETYLAKVITVDKSNDLAILKINKQTPSLPYGFKPYGTQVGESVFAMGYPLIGLQGTEIKVTDGIISSKTGFQNDPTKYQISAPIQPGNSGGPLFDMSGNLIGITSSGITGANSVGYAIKSSILLNFIESQKHLEGFTFASQSTLHTLPSMVSSFSNYVVLIRVIGQ